MQKQATIKTARARKFLQILLLSLAGFVTFRMLNLGCMPTDCKLHNIAATSFTRKSSIVHAIFEDIVVRYIV